MTQGDASTTMTFEEDTAETYAWPRPERILLLPVLHDLIGTTSNETVLDIGCGDGWLTEHFIDAVGIDASQEMIAKASERGTEHDYHVMTAEDLSLNQSFNTIISTFTMHLITPRAKLFEAFTRAKEHLADDGSFTFLIPHPCFVHENDRPYSTWRFDDFNYFDEPQRYNVELKTDDDVARFQSTHYTLQTYIEAIRDADLIVDTIREPHVTDDLDDAHPELWTSEKEKPFFLFIKAKHHH